MIHDLNVSKRKDMTLVFTEEERDYIVNNYETDLVLTEVGMSLVERFTRSKSDISIKVSDADIQAFLAELKEEYRCKVKRISRPDVLTGLVQRFLPDFAAIETEKYC
jgi:hypothetical protein